MSPTPTRLPPWVGPASRVIIRLQRLGVAFFSFRVLTVPGRRSGKMRPTVVSPFTVDDRRYVLSFGHIPWVENARAAGWATLRRGRTVNRVGLTEVKPPDSAAIAAEFPRQVPAGVQFFVRLRLVDPPGTPDQFAAAADRLVLFRLDEAAGR